MAPATPADPPSAPLADFFWIAGVDGSEIFDIFAKLGEEYNAARSQSTPMTDTIEEDADAEEATDLVNGASPGASKRNSYQFLAKPVDEARLSFRSFTSENRDTQSNRSSMTIKGTQSPNGTSFLNDVDFDNAIRKFATERDSFLSDLSLNSNSNTATPNRPRPRPKTQKIVAEEVNPLKSGIGSVRRHMSFREMSSMKRQPSVARQGMCVAIPSFWPL